MRNHESELLYHALCYEEGHPRRTQHILKVYTLAKLLGEKEALSEKDRQILQAAAILHDIAIKYCKEHYAGDVRQISNGKPPIWCATFWIRQNILPNTCLGFWNWYCFTTIIQISRIRCFAS
mgnify:CR=1 FL=1